MYDSWYKVGNNQKKYFSASNTYMHLASDKNGTELRMIAAYQVQTGGYMKRSYAPALWFSHTSSGGKYRKGHFNDACPKSFDSADFVCEPKNISGSSKGWYRNYNISGWYEPVYDKNGDHRAIKRGTDYKRSWVYRDYKNRPGQTEWYSKCNAQRRSKDKPKDNKLWVSDTGNVQAIPNALRKSTYWLWNSEYQDYVKAGGIIVMPKPPEGPILEVDPADGIHGTIRVKYEHTNKPGLDPEPVDIIVTGKSEGGGEDTVLFISKMVSGGSEEKDVVFRNHGFTEGYDIRYEATATDSYGQTASSGWVNGHHYNKAPETPSVWHDDAVVKTESKPYTKINVYHDAVRDMENDNIKYELKYEFYNADGSKATPMRSLPKKSDPDFGEISITHVSDGGRLEFWSTPSDDKEHDNYSETGHHVYIKGFAATRPEQVWPKEKSIVRNKRPRIIIKNGLRDGTTVPEAEQKISVRWMDIWYNNQDHKQYFSSDSMHVGEYTVFKPPTDCFSEDGKVSVSVKADNGFSESKTLDRIFFYKEFEHEKVIPLKSNHVNLLKVAIDDERDAYELKPFTYNRDHGPNTNDVLVIKDEIVFNEDYNSLRQSIIEVNEHINGIDKTAETDYTNYQIPTIKDLDLMDAEFAEWQKLLTMVQNI